MAKKPISQRLRELHSDLLRLSADASLDRRFETVMANLSPASTALWQAIAEAEAQEDFARTKPGAPDTTEAR